MLPTNKPQINPRDILTALKHGNKSFVEEELSCQINILVGKILEDGILCTSTILLQVYKITKKLSINSERNCEIWSRLFPKTKTFLQSLQPYRIIFHEFTHEQKYFYLKFKKGTSFQCEETLNNGNFTLYKLANCSKKILLTFRPEHSPFDDREAFGCTNMLRSDGCREDRWLVISTKETLSLKDWWKKESSLNKREEMIEKILFLLRQEKEFGIPLFNPNSASLIHIQKDKVCSSDLCYYSNQFMIDINKHHEALFHNLNKQHLEDITEVIVKKVKALVPGPLEKTFILLQKADALHWFGDIDLFEPQNLYIAYAFYEYCSLPQEKQVCLEKLENYNSLLVYLQFIQIPHIKFNDIYQLAKKIIQNIPNKNRKESRDNKTFLDVQEKIILELCALCKGFIIQLFPKYHFNLEATINLFISSGFLKRIKNKLNNDAITDEQLQLDDDDWVSTTGDYFEVIFWQRFINDLQTFTDKEVSFYNPHIDLVFARFLTGKFPQDSRLTKLRVKILKQLTKIETRKKLALKLQSRLEKFKTKA